MDIFTANKFIREWTYSSQLRQITNFDSLDRSGDYPTTSTLVTDAVVFTVIITLGRWLLEKLLFEGIVNLFLSSAAPNKLPFKSVELEKIYKIKKFNLPDINEIKELSTQVDLKIEQINKWFRARQAINRYEIKIKRAKECLFRLVMYSICVAVAFIVVVQNEEFMNNPVLSLMNIFKDKPTKIQMDYFTKLEIPLYLHLTVLHIINLDSAEMFVHHTAVLAILCLCYCGNFLYIGAFSVMLHDATDVLLELGRLFNYVGLNTLAMIQVMSLSVSWAYCRIYLFGWKVFIPLFFPVHFNLPKEPNFSQYIGDKVLGDGKNHIASLVGIILVLNLYWMVLISKIAFKSMISGVDSKKRERALTDLSTDDDWSELETDTEDESEDKKQR